MVRERLWFWFNIENALLKYGAAGVVIYIKKKKKKKIEASRQKASIIKALWLDVIQGLSDSTFLSGVGVGQMLA